jgi:excisionase family DNA binding protein
MDTLATPDVPHESSANRYLKVPDVARLMNVPASTVYDLARQNRIVGMVRFGRHIRFDRDKLESWLEQGGERGAA